MSELKKEVLAHNADLGIAVDPDVDRLVFVSEKGETLGEENTLISCADYILSKERASGDKFIFINGFERCMYKI